LISGPWSLWAPYFGREAVDVASLRKQTLATGDVYLAIDHLPRDAVVAGYLNYRQKRDNGSRALKLLTPPEQASMRVEHNMYRTVISSNTHSLMDVVFSDMLNIATFAFESPPGRAR